MQHLQQQLGQLVPLTLSAARLRVEHVHAGWLEQYDDAAVLRSVDAGPHGRLGARARGVARP